MVLGSAELRQKWERSLYRMRTRIQKDALALRAEPKSRGIARDFSFHRAAARHVSYSGSSSTKVRGCARVRHLHLTAAASASPP